MNGCEHCNGCGWIPTCACTPESSVNYSECPHDPEPCPECRGDLLVEDERLDVWGSRGIGTRDEMEADGFLW